MDPLLLHMLAAQIVNTFTLLLFYITDNPIRNAVLEAGYPSAFTVIFVYICSPLVLTYLCMYWTLECSMCLYSFCYNICVVAKEAYVSTTSCVSAVCGGGAGCVWWKCKDTSPRTVTEEPLYQLNDLHVDRMSVISAPPSYHSLPPYYPPNVTNNTLTPNNTLLTANRAYRVNNTYPPPHPPINEIAALRGALGTIPSVPTEQTATAATRTNRQTHRPCVGVPQTHRAPVLQPPPLYQDVAAQLPSYSDVVQGEQG